MISPETSYTKNVANELSFMLVTHTTCFNIRFGRYSILKSGSSFAQIMDRLGIQVLDRVFGPQDE
jgi:small neutral amino acid transporter SnatA (MarC family)